MKKRTYIVSTYNSYEWITTKESYYMFLLRIQYSLKGHTTWNYPIWFIKFIRNVTGFSIYRCKTVYFERYVPGSDQITYHTPYHNFL
jgi:hypothetical protein